MKKNSFIEKVFITNTSGETQELGRDFAKTLKKGDVVRLYGDLGSGKTTFVQGLAQGLGINSRIISPTFVVVRNYRMKNNESNVMDFYHIDLYRMESGKDIEVLGIEEIMNNKNNIVVIEWAEKLKKYCSEKGIGIEFFYEKNDARRIVFRSLNQ
jgi:tRNA threonylcarbamoyladenosine biosynthesis protein TsaE